MNMKNVDWFQGTIIKGGCHSLHLPLASSSMPHSANRLITILGGGMNKTISKCIFDLVNTANPSGGLVRPGNSMWFHNLMIKLFGTVSHDYKKLIKNHACIHDACGFLIKHLENGPGYVYSLFRENFITVSNAGRPSGFINLFFPSQCWLGQITGLRVTRNLMTNVDVINSFKKYDSMDISEEHMNF